MASVFSHAIIATTITKAVFSENDKKLLILAIVSAIIPDLDVLGFYYGIPYEAPMGHRGFTHSILFALLWSMGWAFIQFQGRRLKWFIVLFLTTISHGIIDAFTNGGRGIGFFIPFSNERHFFDYRPITVSPIHWEDFFGEWGLAVIYSELKYVVLPCFIIFGFNLLLRKLK